MGNSVFKVTNGKWTAEDGVFNTAIMNALSRAVAPVPNLDGWAFFFQNWKTGEDAPRYWLQLTSDKGKGDSCADQKIYTLINHPEIGNTGELKHAALAEGEVSWYGGIQIPYAGFEPCGSELKEVTGMIRVSFSGAYEGVDLGIVLDVLRAYIAACDKHLPGGAYIYDFSKLEENQFCNYMMAQKGLLIWG